MFYPINNKKIVETDKWNKKPNFPIDDCLLILKIADCLLILKIEECLLILKIEDWLLILKIDDCLLIKIFFK